MRWTRCLCRLAGILLLAGCAVTLPVPRETSAIAGLRPGSKLLVYPDSGRSFPMRYQEIRNDTLFGYTPDRNVRLPTARLDSLFVLRVSHGRTAAAIIAGISAAVVASLALIMYGYMHTGV